MAKGRHSGSPVGAHSRREEAPRREEREQGGLFARKTHAGQQAEDGEPPAQHKAEPARPQKQKRAKDAQGEWDLGPASRPGYRRMRWVFRIAMGGLFVAAVCAFWPARPAGSAVNASSPAADVYDYQANRILTLDGRNLRTFALQELSTPTPTAVWTFTKPNLNVTAAPAASRTEEQKKELEQAVTDDNGETVYTSANDYFGSDDVLLTFYDILEDVTPTPAPTDTPAPTPVQTLPDGSTPSPAPATAVPTAPPATPAPAGPALTGSGSAACVLAYNGWSTELKQYTYQTAKAYGVSYELVLAIIYHESRFQAGATHLNTNGTTDWGLMQINDVCFSLLNRQLGIGSMNELLDPYKGIQAGCAILAYHLRYVGNEDDALLRYQVGAGNYAYFKANGTVPKSYTNTIAMRQSFYDAGV